MFEISQDVPGCRGSSAHGPLGGEEEKAGSIAYAALHARTEAFLKASRNYQVAVKGPLMDATDVYLQQKAWDRAQSGWAVWSVNLSRE